VKLQLSALKLTKCHSKSIGKVVENEKGKFLRDVIKLDRLADALH